MNKNESIVDELKRQFIKKVLEIRRLPFQETVIKVSAPDMRLIVDWILEHTDFYHLSTITGLDNGQTVELFYHFWSGRGLSLHTELAYNHLMIATITDIIPGASFYEREVHEMLGVQFAGASNTLPLLMDDDWDGEHFSLRKDILNEEEE